MLQQQVGHEMLDRAQAPLKFGPAEGPGFFTPHGWKPKDVRSVLKTAARKKRVSLWMRLLALMPGRIELLLPTDFPAGDAEAQLFLVYRGEVLLSNPLPLLIPESTP